jgi:predicted ATP-dependent endonuclease of OLD family
MGDGFRAKLAILAGIATAKGGVILMEEPESRLHPGVMSSIADQIAQTASRKEVQYIISTHSSDFLEYLLHDASELTNVIRMYRIAEDGEADYEIMNGKEALEGLKDLQLDLRGV